MSRNFDNHPNGSPPNLSQQGFEDLIGSLQSPGLMGPAAPFQHSFAQWPMQWQQTAAQNNFPFTLPHQASTPNQMAWDLKSQNNYIAIGQEPNNDTGMPRVDDADITRRNSQAPTDMNGSISRQAANGQKYQHTFPPGPIPSLSSSSPLALPSSRFNESHSQDSSSAPKSAMVSNSATTARAAELRAKLLASKGSRSRQGSPAVKTNDLGDAKKTPDSGNLRNQTNGDTGSEARQILISGEPNGEEPPAQVPDTTAASLDNLMAEIRDAADARNAGASMTNGKDTEETNGGAQMKSATNGVGPIETTNDEQPPPLNRSYSASELSEPGEIRSNEGSPSPTQQPQPPKTIPPIKAIKGDRDTEEKLARQNEVKKAYQPLKKSNSKKSEVKNTHSKSQLPPKPSPNSQQSRKASFDRRQTAQERPDTGEEPRRDQYRERARDNDSWGDERDPRRPSLSQTYPTPSDLERDVEARRQKLAEDNSRRAAEYKRNLEAQKAQTGSAHSISKGPPEESRREADMGKTPQEPPKTVARKASMPSVAGHHDVVRNDEPVTRDQDIDMISPQATNFERSDDVNDWLELTGFYDERYRERRLELFRKKKALDIQREELEREEELEVQQRTQRTRAQSILSNTTPSSALKRPATANVRMPPPPLPLPFREANKDTGMRIKDTALPAGLPASQTSSPNLKRQHAEDDTESSRNNSIDKRARLDMSGPSSDERPLTSPSSAKGERPPFRSEAPPLESRITRYDSWAPRARSRSPELRRRSFSPRGRRNFSPLPMPPPGGSGYRPPRDYSAGPRRYDDVQHTCFNCGERGHKHLHCPEPRRDGKELQPNTSKNHEQWVSPNYRGVKATGKPMGNKSRLNSVTKAEGRGDVGGGGPSR